MTAENALPSMLILGTLILSIVLIVYSLGARTTLDDALYLFRRPALLTRSMLAIYVIVPCFAVALCLAFPLPPHARFALIALAVSPVPPNLPLKQMKMGGESRFAIGLVVAAALFAIVLTPLLLGLAANLLGSTARISPAAVAKPLLMSIALPLAVGMLVKRFLPGFADASYAYALKLGTLMLLAGAVAILAGQFRTVSTLVGDGTILAIAGTVLVGLVAGHFLGSGSDGDRAALALAAATRHPGVAIAIATFNFPDEMQVAMSTILLFFLVNLVVTLPYVRWAKGRAQRAAAQASPA